MEKAAMAAKAVKLFPALPKYGKTNTHPNNNSFLETFVLKFVNRLNFFFSEKQIFFWFFIL